MLSRLFRLSDKNIGRRFYVVKENDWDVYIKHINNTYSSNFTHVTSNTVNSELIDTINQQKNDIKLIRNDIDHLFARMNECNRDTNNINNKYFVFSAEVRNMLDELSNKIVGVNKEIKK